MVRGWERRLRLLSRKLLRVRTGDEESLDNYLSTVRAWIRSYHFLEPLADWKKPGAGLSNFGESALEFGIAFYLGVAELEHAEWLASQGRRGEAEPLLSEAREIFERLEAKPWLERLTAATAEEVPV